VGLELLTFDYIYPDFFYVFVPEAYALPNNYYFIRLNPSSNRLSHIILKLISWINLSSSVSKGYLITVSEDTTYKKSVAGGKQKNSF